MRHSAWILALALASCASPERVPYGTSSAVNATADAAWRGAHEVRGTTGSFVVRWLTTPVEIPMNEEFALRAWVFAAQDLEHPLTDVELVVDAAMPEHKHGMARAPKRTRGADGSFDVSGLLFHMPGRWELYFDVAKGELTERAQVRIDLE